MIATPISRNIRAIKTTRGIICPNKRRLFPVKSIVHAKPTITFNRVCPAIIFAKSRTAKLMGLKT